MNHVGRLDFGSSARNPRQPDGAIHGLFGRFSNLQQSVNRPMQVLLYCRYFSPIRAAFWTALCQGAHCIGEH